MEPWREVCGHVVPVFREQHDKIMEALDEQIDQNCFGLDGYHYRLVMEVFSQLLYAFSEHMEKPDLKGYLKSNEALAVQLALNDVPAEAFLNMYHLFEESHNEFLRREFSAETMLEILSALDHVHHKTLAVIMEEYLRINDRTVFALAKMAEARDPLTGYHLERTRDFALQLAKTLKLEESFCGQLYRVGPLHDVGKIAIPDQILLKQGPLTEAEWEIMRTHPQKGADSIASIVGNGALHHGYLLMAMEVALHHHERWDGTGYPHQLKGQSIPLAARIFALADSYDVMVNLRPYKEPIPHKVVVSMLTKDAGSHFDPDVVGAFLDCSDAFITIHRQFQERSEQGLHSASGWR